MTYEDVQRKNDWEWRQAWAALPAAERARIEGAMAANKEAPVLMKAGAVVHETSHAEAEQGLKVCVGRREDAGEIAEHHESFRETPDVAARADGLAARLREMWALGGAEAVAAWHEAQMKEEGSRASAEQVAKVIGWFLLPGNLRLRAYGLAHVVRMRPDGHTSLRQSAAACCVTPWAMCKVAAAGARLMGLPVPEGGKSEAAKENYRRDKQTNHWRKQKCNGSMSKQQKKKALPRQAKSPH